MPASPEIGQDCSNLFSESYSLKILSPVFPQEAVQKKSFCLLAQNGGLVNFGYLFSGLEMIGMDDENFVFETMNDKSQKRLKMVRSPITNISLHRTLLGMFALPCYTVFRLHSADR